MKKIYNGILAIMRIFIISVCIGLSSIYANPTLAQPKIDIDVEDVTLEDFFKEIQNSSEYVFFYKDNVLETNKMISINMENSELSNILDKAFLNTSLTYIINGKQAIVRKIPKQSVKSNLEKNEVVIQQITVTGNVVDDTGQPLIGVNILIQGTLSGAQTDFDGNYTINIDEGAILEFSYISMLTQTIAVENKTVINIIMQQDSSSLDEVLVTGYGIQTKESLTGSVGLVTSKTLEQAPTSTFEQSLRGSMAGLQATAIDGGPGANTQIRIRGIGSITASSEPLYVIDGIPVQSGSIATNDNDGRSTNVMSAINPNDIESITVLKDAGSKKKRIGFIKNLYILY